MKQNHPLLDPSVLQNYMAIIADSSSDLLAELIDIYVSDSQIRLQAMQRAWLHNDIEQLQQSVHTLKGESAYIGAEKLRQHCQMLEQAIQQQNRDQITDQLDQITQIHAETLALLKTQRSEELSHDEL